jgi:plasmid stabilization system protein ParE
VRLDFITTLKATRHANVERSDHIDVWRVLHGMRHIPSWMQDPDLI